MTLDIKRPAPAFRPSEKLSVKTGSYVSLDNLGVSAGLAGDDPLEGFDLDQELAAFEARERERLGLGTAESEVIDHWVEPIFDDPTTASKATTTILMSGLTLAHDYFVAGAMAGLGYTMQNLDEVDSRSLTFGKEFGNRGQCNPTYFTVGNLVKYLVDLRDVKGMETKEIIDRYVFMTAGSCGPCRFGMYVTEYRKALRDAGFEGFRVLLFSMQGGWKQASGDASDGLVFDPPFFVAILKALVAGDVINAMAYRIRPYELEAGATDRAVAASKRCVHDALAAQTSLVAALLTVRRTMGAVAVDKTRVKPKVAIIGEFWAMTTEGDGNYRMQRFLEGEGAEVDAQLVTAWVLFLAWEHWRDTRHRMTLRRDDTGRKGLDGVAVMKKLATVKVGEHVLRGLFQSIANVTGLHGYHLPDMDELASIAGDFYNNDLRGGEGHLEVAKVIVNVVRTKVNMTLSIKPFGCMPSSGVSDGVQSAVTELYPDAIFLPVETTGDGAVNVYSRVQMMLFKARQAAQREVDEALDAYGMTMDEVRSTIERFPVLGHPLLKPPHRRASTAADVVELVGTVRHPLRALKLLRTRRAQGRGVKSARFHAGATA